MFLNGHLIVGKFWSIAYIEKALENPREVRIWAREKKNIFLWYNYERIAYFLEPQHVFLLQFCANS